MHNRSNEIHLDEKSRAPLTYEDLAMEITKFEDASCNMIFYKNENGDGTENAFAVANARVNEDGLIVLEIHPTSKSMQGKKWICVVDQDGNINGRLPKIFHKALEVISVTLTTKNSQRPEGHNVETSRIFNRRAQFRIAITGVLRQPTE